MGFLTEQAAERFGARKRAYVPEWFAAAQIVALVLAGVFLAFLVIKASVATPGEGNTPGLGLGVPQPGAPSISSEPDPTTSDPTQAPSSAPTQAPVAAGVLTLPVTTDPGQELQVPLPAVEAARAGARALFTGNFAPVPLASVYTPPDPSTLNLSPAATAGAATSAVAYGEDTFLIVVSIDIDGAGPAPARDVPARVMREMDTWGFFQVAG